MAFMGVAAVLMMLMLLHLGHRMTHRLQHLRVGHGARDNVSRELLLLNSGKNQRQKAQPERKTRMSESAQHHDGRERSTSIQMVART